VRNWLRRLASLTGEAKQHAPYLPCVFLFKAEALGGKVELLVRVLFLGVGVAHVLVNMVQIRASVVAIECAAEGGAVQDMTEVLVQMIDEETASHVSQRYRSKTGSMRTIDSCFARSS
jgi:hypothetical protein